MLCTVFICLIAVSAGGGAFAYFSHGSDSLLPSIVVPDATALPTETERGPLFAPFNPTPGPVVPARRGRRLRTGSSPPLASARTSTSSMKERDVEASETEGDTAAHFIADISFNYYPQTAVKFTDFPYHLAKTIEGDAARGGRAGVAARGTTRISRCSSRRPRAAPTSRAIRRGASRSSRWRSTALHDGETAWEGHPCVHYSGYVSAATSNFVNVNEGRFVCQLFVDSATNAPRSMLLYEENCGKRPGFSGILEYKHCLDRQQGVLEHEYTKCNEVCPTYANNLDLDEQNAIQHYAALGTATKGFDLQTGKQTPHSIVEYTYSKISRRNGKAMPFPDQMDYKNLCECSAHSWDQSSSFSSELGHQNERTTTWNAGYEKVVDVELKATVNVEAPPSPEGSAGATAGATAKTQIRTAFQFSHSDSETFSSRTGSAEDTQSILLSTEFRRGEAELQTTELNPFSLDGQFITDVLNTARSLRSAQEDCSFSGITKEQCRYKGCMWNEAGPTCFKTDIKDNIIEKYGTHLLQKFTIGCYSSYKLTQNKKFFQNAEFSFHKTSGELDMEYIGFKAGFNKAKDEQTDRENRSKVGVKMSDFKSFGCPQDGDKFMTGCKEVSCTEGTGNNIVIAKDKYYAISDLIDSAMKMNQLRLAAKETSWKKFDPDLLQGLEQDDITTLSTEMENIVTELLSVEYKICTTAGSTSNREGICIVDKISERCEGECLCYDKDVDKDVDEARAMPGQKRSSCTPKPPKPITRRTMGVEIRTTTCDLSTSQSDGNFHLQGPGVWGQMDTDHDDRRQNAVDVFSLSDVGWLKPGEKYRIVAEGDDAWCIKKMEILGYYINHEWSWESSFFPHSVDLTMSCSGPDTHECAAYPYAWLDKHCENDYYTKGRCYSSFEFTFPGNCDVQDTEKQDCGSYGIDKRACERKGCCWDTGHGHNIPDCFMGQ